MKRRKTQYRHVSEPQQCRHDIKNFYLASDCWASKEAPGRGTDDGPPTGRLCDFNAVRNIGQHARRPSGEIESRLSTWYYSDRRLM